MKRRLVVIPTFNEAGNIKSLIDQLFTAIPGVEVMVVDDGSPDGTALICKVLQEKNKNMHLIERHSKSGIGSAYRMAFVWALEQGFDEIVEMDADGSHQVTDLLRMIDAKTMNPDVGLIIGSRWIRGGKTVNWPRSRELLSRLANRYVRIALGMGVNDSTAGFRIYSAQTLRKIDLGHVRSEGYSFQIEMTRAAHKSGAVIMEVPITFKERENGVSKMSKNIVREAMFLVTVWGLKRLLRIK
jgi:dolichol-phosphate mannosyltransferase